MSKVATLIDSGGQVSSKEFHDACSLTDMQTFLAAHSAAGLTGANTVTELAVTGTLAEADSDKTVKALLYYKDGDGVNRQMSIPAPKGLTIVMTEDGERIDATTGQACSVAHATANGYNTTGLVFSVGLIVDHS